MQVYYVSYFTHGFKIGPSIERNPIKAYRVNGDVAYCIEHGVDTSTTAKLTGRKSENSYLERVYNSSESTKHIIRNMSLCLLYGRQEDSKMSTLYNELGFRSSSYYKKTASSYNLDDWEAATRQLIHETQQCFRDEKFNKLSTNGLCYADGYSQGGINSGGTMRSSCL